MLQMLGVYNSNGKNEFSQIERMPRQVYRDEINSLQIQLSRTQAGPGRAVKEQQELNSPNHIQRINLISVYVQVLFR